MGDELTKQLESLKGILSVSADMPSTLPQEPVRGDLPVQLPFWPEPVRGGPNAVLRSSLFAGIHSKKRETIGNQTKPEKPLQAVTLASQDGITVKFAGRQLNQYDADVFFEALHRARHHPLETECLFTGYGFLKGIRRAPNDLGYEDLDDSLTRLRDGRVEVHWKMHGRGFKFVGSLVSSYVRDETTKLFKVTFAKEIKALFAPACWTQIEWEERMALRGHPLAQWLHSYYSTHADPFPVGSAFLCEKSGSKRPLMKNFRTDLKQALATLHRVLGWECELDKKSDNVTVVRTPSGAQARHLARAKAKKDSQAETQRVLEKQRRAAEAQERLKRGKGKLEHASEIIPSLFANKTFRT